ncbi:MAG: hypothetical protein HC834_08470 [Rhodospirillales bacterium]|nr:hypothetical protein [Rhodospirillales bacterium]
METLTETFESFDQSLKYLLQYSPADFIRFGLGLGEAQFAVQEPTESGLPRRGRDIDGCYIMDHLNRRTVVHIEFHRRHQKLEDLCLDVGEAQIRLRRRERLPVLSLVWTLYGKSNQAVLVERHFSVGPGDEHSRVSYQQINLRGMTAQALLEQAPPVLWPLIALTHDGAQAQAIVRCRDAIETRPELDESARADFLAVLWFVAEAENVPVRLLQDYITEERLMESVLYRSIFEKGQARGRAEGEARGELHSKGETIIRVLGLRLGELSAAVRERIEQTTDLPTLSGWYEQALLILDAADARQLVEQIEHAPPAH